MAMLRDLPLLTLIGWNSALEGCNEPGHVVVPAQRSEALSGIAERAGDPPEHHLPITPTLDVVRVVGDQAVEVLDRVGRPKGAIQRAGDAQTLQRQRLLETFSNARRGSRMIGLK